MTLCKERKQAKIKEVASSIKGLPENERKGILEGAEELIRAATPKEIRALYFDALVGKGLLDVLGMDKDETWEYVSDPNGRHNSYLLVCNGITLSKLMTWVVVDGKLGKNHLDLNFVKDVIEVPQTLFYWRYDIEDGRKMLNVSPLDCEKQFKKEGRLGFTAREGAHKCVYEPDILKHHCMDCLGSRGARARVSMPCLYLFGRRPRLDALYAGHASPYSGSASSGE